MYFNLEGLKGGSEEGREMRVLVSWYVDKDATVDIQVKILRHYKRKTRPCLILNPRNWSN